MDPDSILVGSTLGKFIIEAREDPDVAEIVGKNPDSVPPRVAYEAGVGWVTKPYKAFVLMHILTAPPHRRLPISRPRIAVRAYGRDKEEAALLAATLQRAFHQVGPRVHNNGMGIYGSWDDTGPTQDEDPVTSQPVVEFILDSFVTTQVVAT